MLCSNCSANQASFHYKYIQNGKSGEIHLCADCARKLGYIKDKEAMLSPVSFLGDIFSVPHFTSAGKPAPSCPGCGAGYDEIRRSGFVGCDRCFEAFGTLIDTMLSKIQPSTTHKGRLEGTQGKKIERDNTIKSLKEELSRAILDERYEEAAVIRDKIKNLEAKGGEE